MPEKPGCPRNNRKMMLVATLANLTASTPVLSMTDATASTSANRFYRVILNP
jgi:hypothetical protein